MATNEKVDVVIVGAGASGSVYASVLAKAGKSVVVLDNGPDWQLQDLISSEFWGPSAQACGRPRHSRGQASVRLYLAGRLGRRWRGAALLRQFPALSADRLQDQKRAQSRPRLADLV
jgi:choline dehydrogenase-like flavoprotein